MSPQRLTARELDRIEADLAIGRDPTYDSRKSWRETAKQLLAHIRSTEQADTFDHTSVNHPHEYVP